MSVLSVGIVDVIDFVATPDNEGCYIDVMGAIINDTKWVLRFKLILSTVTEAGNRQLIIGFSSVTERDNSTTSQDFIGMAMHSIDTTFNAVDADGVVMDSKSSQAFAENLAAQTLWVEIIRVSTTSFTVELFSDAFSTSIEKETVAIDATVASLRYLAVQSLEVSGSGAVTGTMDDVEFWDAVATTTEAEPDTIDDMARDDSTATLWKSTSEVAPAIYADMGSAVDIVGVAIWPHADTTVTEIKIRCSTDATFSDAENVRTITYSNLTEGAYNYIRFNRLGSDRRYLQIIGTDAGSLILAINEIKVLRPTTVTRDHTHLTISTSDTSIGLDGT